MPVREWTPAQKALMRWLCLPGDDKLGKGRGLRDPKTLTALAEKLKVSRETLYEWQDLSGWSEALAVMAKQVTVELEPEYLKTLSVAMTKDNPNDRLVTAYWRYIHPILHDEKDRGEWANILPETTANRKDDTNFLLEQFRKLPMEHREQILNEYDQWVTANQSGDVLTEEAKFRVRRMVTEAEEKLEAEILAEEQDQSIVEVKALPVAGRIVEGKTAGDLPRVNTSGKWKSNRKSKSSYW